MSGTLGEEILSRRRKAHKTLRFTAQEADISASLLSLIEREKHTPSREVIERLASVLGGDVDRWCGLAGRITTEAEESLAKLAIEQPEFYRQFRTIVDRGGS